MNYIIEIQQWLSEHSSTTLPQWLNRNPEIKTYVEQQTLNIPVKNIMESVYILLYGKPTACSKGNHRKFNTFELGYREGCILGNKCQCVKEIRKTKQKITLQEKYGVDSVSQIPGIVEKRKNTNLERYGTEWQSQTSVARQHQSEISAGRTQEQRSIIKQKTRETNLKKYGVEHHMNLVSQREKVANTNILRYQSKTPLQNPDVVKRMIETLAEKSQLDIEQSNDKRRNTMKQKYGVDAASQMPVPTHVLDILNDPKTFGEFIQDKTRQQVVTELNIHPHTLYLHAKKYGVSDNFIRPTSSLLEQEISEFIGSLGLSYRTNDRSIISPKEIDIFLPEQNIAIECCGLYWHSENGGLRTKNYHYEKYLATANQNIRLITIFEDEWNYKQLQVKNRLQHLLEGNQEEKIYARQCSVKSIDAKTARQFVEIHHLQGNVTSQINLALIHNEKIVAVMTFGKPRYNKEHDYEILRFCTQGAVIGAASKLFQAFIRSYQPNRVISYSDNRWGDGSVYKAMGFIEQDTTVGYFYTNYKQRFNRQQFQKHKLVSEGHDPTLTEWQIMQNQGFDRIWDCGQTRWTYTINTEQDNNIR